MTKRKKIKRLATENKRLAEENKALKKREHTELTNKMLLYMETYEKLNKKIQKKYKELNELKWSGSKIKWNYKLRLIRWKMKVHLAKRFTNTN